MIGTRYYFLLGLTCHLPSHLRVGNFYMATLNLILTVHEFVRQKSFLVPSRRAKTQNGWYPIPVARIGFVINHISGFSFVCSIFSVFRLFPKKQRKIRTKTRLETNRGTWIERKPEPELWL